MKSFLNFILAVVGVAIIATAAVGAIYLSNLWFPKPNPYKIRCETEYHGIHVYEFRSESCWTTDGRRIFMKAE